MDKPRFIERSFPVKEVSKESAREKSIRHGHISTLHVWWARRPLASSRATSYAALIPKPTGIEEWNVKKNFIIKLSKWENSSDSKIIEKARKDILKAFKGKKPKVLDPFAGGGAIPLETLRLGCETYSSDYNPVAVIIEKCTLEYPQRYGKKLVSDVHKWGEWVLKEAMKELKFYYPIENIKIKGSLEGSFNERHLPVGYLWSRTIRCLNPSCLAEVPLFKHFWLAKKPNKRIALFPIVDKKGKKIAFRIVGDGNKKIPEDFNPSKGTISRAIASCLICGSSISAKDVRKQFQDGKNAEKLIVVVYLTEGKKGKKYKIATKKDIMAYKKVNEYFKIKCKNFKDKYLISPIPDEEIPLMSGVFNVPIYGMNTWGSLFNQRQKLVLLVFAEKIRAANKKMNDLESNTDYIKAVISILCLCFDRLADYNSNLTSWHPSREVIRSTFGRQALPMIWDHFELYPNSKSSGDWNSALKWVIKVLEHTKNITEEAKVFQASATNLPFENNFFDAVFTDPPYYNSIPYADLSDFFYVWMKRIIGDLYPDLFSTHLTPKTKEIVEMSSWDSIRYGFKTKEFFEKNLMKVFSEISRVLKPNGIAIIVYAHKTTEGWETIINALNGSGLTVTASWPIATEMIERMRALKSAALASSIYIIARKFKKTELGIYEEIKKEISQLLPKRLERLWQEGILGVDFFIAAIGVGLEVFGKYEKILSFDGEIIRADKLLEEIRVVTIDFALKRIFKSGFKKEITPLTRFYILWRWLYQEVKVPFDDAKKLAQSVGINLEDEWDKGFIKKERQHIRIQGPLERDLTDIENSNNVIDILHYTLILWNDSKRKKILSILVKSPISIDLIFRLAHAISQTLPSSSKEKLLLDGFLSGREAIKRETREKSTHKKLDSFLRS